MNLIRYVILFTSFFLDVHVRAETILAADVTRVVTKLKDARVSLAPGALGVADGAALKLVRGRVYAEGSFELTTPYANFACAGAGCAAMFTREAASVRVDALSAGWRVRPRGFDREYAVDEATRVVVGEVGRDGRAVVEPPQALAWAPLVRGWAALYAGAPERFVARVRHFRPRWADAVTNLSEAQRGRALAAADAELRRRAARARAARAAAAEDERLRRMFRERNFVED